MRDQSRREGRKVLHVVLPYLDSKRGPEQLLYSKEMYGLPRV